MNDRYDNHNPVFAAISRRIIMSETHRPLLNMGLTKLIAIIEEVADEVGDVEEIGTSDVSCWIDRVYDKAGMEIPA